MDIIISIKYTKITYYIYTLNVLTTNYFLLFLCDWLLYDKIIIQLLLYIIIKV